MYPYQVQKFEPFEPNQGKYYVIEMGKSGDLRKQILGLLQKKRAYLEEVHSVDDCNVILVFCPIVSRAGTDIDAALNELNTCSASKLAILMVFHHSFDCNKTVPESSRYINRRNTLTVDCLFYEDEGLLSCKRNEEALAKIVQCFKNQKEEERKMYPYQVQKFEPFETNQDEGLLACERNEEALAKIVQCFKNQNHFLEIVQTFFHYMWHIFQQYRYHGCCWIFAKVTNHFLEIVLKFFDYMWHIFKKNLHRGCCWIFAKVTAIWPGEDRGTYESSEYTERSRLIHADEVKNA